MAVRARRSRRLRLSALVLLTSVLLPSTVLAQDLLCRIVFRVASTGSLGSIGWNVDYSGADGEFVGTGNNPQCTGLVAGALTAYFDNDAGRVLNGALITADSFSTPRNLTECWFRAPFVPWAGDFDVTVNDAAYPSGATVVPLPTVSIPTIECEPAGPATTTTTTTLPPAECREWDLWFRLDSASKAVGALQFSASYATAPGEVIGSDGLAECSSLLSGVFFSRNDSDAQKKLTLSFIALSTITASRDLARCRFLGDSALDLPVPADFPITIEDSADIDGVPISANVSVRITAAGDAASCQSQCGDGVVNGSEPCDDGNFSNADACLTNCVAAKCGDGYIRTGVEQCDDGNVVNTDACLGNCTTAKCGDGYVRSGVEQCDDGNLVNTDACLGNCTAAKCGDGYVRSGVEQCDDGNLVNTDACLGNCTAAKCGDGYVRSGVEQCDDGNVVNTDACLTTCVAAKCGDGIVRTGVEQCDDANQVSADACTNNCTTARCGDGIVRTGVEQCDDGNVSNSDACVASCVPARCGDGYLRSGVEECDDGNAGDGDGCSPSCEEGLICGDPTGDGKTLVGDALRALQSAVGAEVLCPDWTCDVNGDGGVSASDALSMMRMAVALPVTRLCPEPSLLKLRLVDARTFGGLQFEVDYSSVEARLAGDGDQVQCKGLVAGTSFVFNDTPSDVLAVAMLRLEGFSGPRWVAECRLVPDGLVRASDFRFRVLDAQSPTGVSMTGVQLQAVPF